MNRSRIADPGSGRPRPGPALAGRGAMRELFTALLEQIDPGPWWPADTRFEILVGAILVQNTAWTNVERALARMRAAGLLDPEGIESSSPEHLASVIRPCGYHRAKTAYLKEATAWFLRRDEEARRSSTPDLRAELLAIRGIGMETADVLLLYVYERPLFIYDAYARRLLSAAGMGAHPDYARAKTALDPLVDEAGFSLEELALFHGLIVESGKIARMLGGWEECLPLLESGRLGAAARAGGRALQSS